MLDCQLVELHQLLFDQHKLRGPVVCMYIVNIMSHIASVSNVTCKRWRSHPRAFCHIPASFWLAIWERRSPHTCPIEVKRSQKSQVNRFSKISTIMAIDKIQKFTHPASTREGRTCRTGQSPPRNEDIRDIHVRKDINLLHGNDVRCIVTHLVQNAFLPEDLEIQRRKFSVSFVLPVLPI